LYFGRITPLYGHTDATTASPRCSIAFNETCFVRLNSSHAGNTEGQYNVGTHIYKGTGGEQQSYDEAVRWWNLAADKGWTSAEQNLG
jgi:TPR repeat protein